MLELKLYIYILTAGCKNGLYARTEVMQLYMYLRTAGAAAWKRQGLGSNLNIESVNSCQHFVC